MLKGLQHKTTGKVRCYISAGTRRW